MGNDCFRELSTSPRGTSELRLGQMTFREISTSPRGKTSNPQHRVLGFGRLSILKLQHYQNMS